MLQKFILITILLDFIIAKSQSCEDLILFVKSEDYGTTYNSPTSTASIKVSFHTVYIDYERYFFAIVCFKSKYSYCCTESINQVSPNTKLNYSMNYLDSAGEAFWEYI
ncbi:hypothetical protein SAMN04488552_2889 [Christiangramia echinicola]|uniref:Uncharacterized protein n=1 Tax=Christiangramia echinicola TaxID=279359 RepID=A0A1H1RGZ1_9FLAO|nr:hypothetical protein SAMN04488552_2889 [Christiangramia echinicola]